MEEVMVPPAARLVSRTMLRDCARRVRRMALAARRPVFLFRASPVTLTASLDWDERMGELFALYTEGVKTTWIEADLYEFVRGRGATLFVP